jgi:hypothetical protein
MVFVIAYSPPAMPAEVPPLLLLPPPCIITPSPNSLLCCPAAAAAVPDGLWGMCNPAAACPAVPAVNWEWGWQNPRAEAGGAAGGGAPATLYRLTGCWPVRGLSEGAAMPICCCCCAESQARGSCCSCSATSATPGACMRRLLQVAGAVHKGERCTLVSTGTQPHTGKILERQNPQQGRYR